MDTATTVELEWGTLSDFARQIGSKPSYVTQLINTRRIPEAHRDENGKYTIPLGRRCVIPAKYPRPGAKINEFFFRRYEVPWEWIDDESARPPIGKPLVGSEDEPLKDRIERTFGVKVEPVEEIRPPQQGDDEDGYTGSGRHQGEGRRSSGRSGGLSRDELEEIVSSLIHRAGKIRITIEIES